MIPVIVVCCYLAVIAVIGSVAFRQSKANTEDFFLANRTVGSMVFFLSIFATNMTAFAILGSSGQAYRQGIGIYGLMASSSGFLIPLTIFFIGTRLWAFGKRYGHQTQVAFFRDRWECSTIGTLIFVLSVVMLVPYMIISIMGGGRVLHDISGGLVAYWLGCAVVALVVTVNVFFGGMRGTVWVNIFQTILFLLFGAVAVAVISHSLNGGFGEYIGKIAANPKAGYLITRERMSERYFWSYTLIPLSSIMFPHMAIMCFAARKVTAFKRTVILYPLAIMAIWLPCVFLGVIGTQTSSEESRRHPLEHAHRTRAGLAGGYPGRGDNFRGHGLRHPPSAGAQHHVHQRPFCLLWRQEEIWRARQCAFCARVHSHRNGHRLFYRAHHPGKHL